MSYTFDSDHFGGIVMESLSGKCECVISPPGQKAGLHCASLSVWGFFVRCVRVCEANVAVCGAFEAG